jgi:hypothetical protein
VQPLKSPEFPKPVTDAIVAAMQVEPEYIGILHDPGTISEL